MLASTALHTATANIINFDGTPIQNTRDGCASSEWEWSMAVAQAETGPNRCRFWTVTPSSPAGAGGRKALSFDFQHLEHPAGKAHDKEVNPNPAKPVTVAAGSYTAGATPKGQHLGGALVQQHGGHKDVYSWFVDVPAAGPNARLDATAQHIGEAFTSGWSYNPLGGGATTIGLPAVINKVEASYPSDPPKSATDIPKGKLKANEKRTGTLPRSVNKQPPTDYTIRVTIGDPYFSEMNLAFVTGQPGSFEHAELGVMNEFFTGGREFEVPMLFDLAEQENLYIAVDLTQWLLFQSFASFAAGEIFDVMDGIPSNSLHGPLDGFLIATSPIAFDPLNGFTARDRWTGTATVLGLVDGHNIPVPEPSLAALVAIALLAWTASGRRATGTPGPDGWARLAV